MNLSSISDGEILIRGQAVILRDFATDRAREIGQQIINYFSNERSVTEHIDIPGVKVLKLNPFQLGADLPEVQEFQTQTVLGLHERIAGLGNWGLEESDANFTAQGHLVDPQKGFTLHRDNSKITKIVAIVNLLKRREIILAPAENKDQLHSDYLDEGEALILDADARPWHATENKTQEIGLTMAILESPRIPLLKVDNYGKAMRQKELISVYPRSLWMTPNRIEVVRQQWYNG